MMISYYDLPIALQITFMVLQFLAICMGVCMVPQVFSKKKRLHKILLPLGILLSVAMLGVYSSNIRAQKTETATPATTRWISEKPVWIAILLLLAILAYMVYLFVVEYRRRKKTITQFSIKEGLDSLSSGLCFYEPSGKIILANSAMNTLCHRLLGQDLQNAVLFWQLLQKGDVLPEADQLSGGDGPTFRLPDGAVWSFACEKLGNVFQLTAADTTQIYGLTARLKEENKH